MCIELASCKDLLNNFFVCIPLVNMADQLWSDVEIFTLLQAYNNCYTSNDKELLLFRVAVAPQP